MMNLLKLFGSILFRIVTEKVEIPQVQCTVSARLAEVHEAQRMEDAHSVFRQAREISLWHFKTR